MEKAIQINLSEDFQTLCTIYQIEPQFFIQRMIDQVSLPEYYNNPSDANRWGTLFFLHFLECETSGYIVDKDLEEQYLTAFNIAMGYKFDTAAATEDDALAKGRDVMRQWLKAVVGLRSKYLTDNL